MNQSRLLAEYLYENKEKYRVDTLISSDLKRAVETAKQILVKFDISSDWRETNNGVLAGMQNSIALEKYPGIFFKTLRMDERYPGGESPIEFYNRIKVSYKKLCNRILNGEIGPNVMIVTHGGVINIIYNIVNGLEWTNKSGALCKIANTGIHIIKYTSEGWKVNTSNKIEHLI